MLNGEDKGSESERGFLILWIINITPRVPAWIAVSDWSVDADLLKVMVKVY